MARADSKPLLVWEGTVNLITYKTGTKNSNTNDTLGMFTKCGAYMYSNYYACVYDGFLLSRILNTTTLAASSSISTAQSGAGAAPY